MNLVKHFVLLLALGIFFAGVEAEAQTKKSEKEKREQLRKMEESLKEERKVRQVEIERALEEAKVLEEEQLEELLEQHATQKELALKSYRRAMEEAKGAVKLGELDEALNFSGEWPDFEFKAQDFYATPYRGFYSTNKEATSLNIQKEIEDLTFETQFKYEVQTGSESFLFAASGTVDEGTIKIRLIKPDGLVAQEFEVSPLADVKWSQRLKWDEESEKDNVGTWTITVSANQATGNYNVTVRAN